MRKRRHALAVLAHCLGNAPSDDLPAGEDWEPVLELANEHLLTPALWSALSESGHAASLPVEVADYLASLHRLNGERNRALRRQAVELIAALNERAIVPALLKGGLALFCGPYADPAVRMMRDLDLLVPAIARDDAIAVLERLGYRLTRQYPTGHHAIGDFARPNDPGSVDLHIELVDPSYILSAVEVWSRGALQEIDGVRYVAPSATDRILHNVLHAQVHYLGDFYRGGLPVQQIYEFVALARRFGPAIDWSFIRQRLQSHRLTTVLESYLLLAHRLLEFDWPFADPPSLAARLHCLRCEVQFGVQPLQWIGVPWGNVRGAFAWHRMRALHGGKGGALRWRCRHLVQYLRKKPMGATLGRLRRVD